MLPTATVQRYFSYKVNYTLIDITHHVMSKSSTTSGYATWFTARGAICIANYDVIDDVITWNV